MTTDLDLLDGNIKSMSEEQTQKSNPQRFSDIRDFLRIIKELGTSPEQNCASAKEVAEYSWIFFPLLNDQDARHLDELLTFAYEHSDPRPGFTGPRVAFRRALAWIKRIPSPRMTDQEEQDLRKELSESFFSNALSPAKLDSLILDLRERWGDLTPQLNTQTDKEPEKISPKYPAAGEARESKTRLNNIASLWQKLTAYERGFLFDWLQDFTAMDPNDLSDALAHLPEACRQTHTQIVDAWPTIKEVSKRKGFFSINILIQIYKKHFGEQPTRQEDDDKITFYTFVDTVMFVRLKTEEPHDYRRAIDALKEPDGTFASMPFIGENILQFKPYPKFESIHFIKKDY
ncbi:MAG: hypothetical protein WC959_01405 [Kiritimatiellales bacterium]